jgi:hypothetical protein
MPDLDLDALAAVAEAATPGEMYFDGIIAQKFRSMVGPDVVLALIAEVRRARAEAIRENAQMLTVQDELKEALDSICEHKAAMTDMRRRKEAAEAELERLRGKVAALAEEPAHYPGQCCPEGYCVADLHELDAAQRDRFRDILRALIGGGR